MEEIWPTIRRKSILVDTDKGVIGNLFAENGRLCFSVLNPERNLTNTVLHSSRNTYCSEMVIPLGSSRDSAFGCSSVYNVRMVYFVNSVKKKLLDEHSCKILQIVYDKKVIDSLRYHAFIDDKLNEIKTSDSKIIIRVRDYPYLEGENVVSLSTHPEKYCVVEFEKTDETSFEVEEIDRLVFNANARLGIFHRRPVVPMYIQGINNEQAEGKDSIIRFNIALCNFRKESFQDDIFESYIAGIRYDDLNPINAFSGDMLELDSPTYLWRAFAMMGISKDAFLENRLYYLLVCIDKLFSLMPKTIEKKDVRNIEYNDFIASAKEKCAEHKKVLDYISSKSARNSYLEKESFEVKVRKVFGETDGDKKDYPKIANSIRNDLMHRGIIDGSFYEKVELYDFITWLTDNVQRAIIRYTSEELTPKKDDKTPEINEG